MTEQPRNWDKELADIDRVIEKQGGPAGPRGAGPVAPRPAPAALPRGGLVDVAPRGSVAITWLWTLFGLALGVALVIWPYQRACGLQAFFYLGAAGVTLLVGGLAALSSWANRRGLAHVLSLLVIAWAGVAAASEILPRIGYARVARTWSCSVPASPAPTAAPAPRTEAAPAPQTQVAPAPQGQVAPAPQGQAAPAPQGQAAPGPAPQAQPDSAPRVSP